MRYLRLLALFFRVALQQELAYRSNFLISLLSSALNLITGILGVVILFSQVQKIHGWTLPSTLALLGVYLTVGALRSIVIGPSLNALAGLDGEIWTGRLDFTLLRPVNLQFLVSFRNWHPYSFIDLLLGLSILGLATIQMQQSMTLPHVIVFLFMLMIGVVMLYSILLIFAGLAFWQPNILFTWIFDSLFDMARYPVGLYPDWARILLTWIIPIGIITTFPAQALSGTLPLPVLLFCLPVTLLMLVGASMCFQSAIRHYSSASS